MIVRIVMHVIILATFIMCQMPKKEPVLPLMDDIPYIICDTCQKAARYLYKVVRRKQEEVKPKKLGEEEIISIVEKACDPEAENGNWILKLDITQSDEEVRLVEHKNEGRCKEECKTISRACHDAVGDIDTDVGELLWKNSLKMSPFINEVCYSLSKVCAKKRPKIQKGKRKDFKFIEMDEQEKEAIKMKRQFQGMPGMPGMEMYSKEDLENMKKQFGVSNEESADEQLSEKTTKKNEMPYKTQVGFLDTVKAVGGDILNKIKKFFSFGGDDKVEL